MSTHVIPPPPSAPASAADAERSPDRPAADVVVTGRNVEVPDHFRVHVADKLARLERLDRSIYSFEVELDHEKNRRQRKSCQHVEITARGRGPVVRAEACAESFYAALDSAIGKLEGRLRRTKDRRKVHYGDKTPVSVAQATAAPAGPEPGRKSLPGDAGTGAYSPAEPEDAHPPGRIVRTKQHPAVPMTVDDALYEMELVGHDFFLFHDSASDRPAVVYRRHAYDYGLIQLGSSEPG